MQAAAIQHDLARVGIAVDVRSTEFPTLLGDVLRGQLPALHAAVRRRHGSRHAAPRVSLAAGAAGGPEPRASIRNPEVDRLIEAAARRRPTTTRGARCTCARSRLIAEDVPYISLWYKTNVAVFQPDIQGVRLSPIADFTFLKDVYRQPSR